MIRRLPPDAFAYFIALPVAQRSYGAVGEHFKVSKTAVANLAKRDGWLDKASELDRKTAEAATQRALETVEAMNHRHLKAAMVVQAKALDALRSFSLTSALDAVRSLELDVRQERLIRGQPTDRTEVDIAQVIRREYERWMTTPAPAPTPPPPEVPPETPSGGADAPS